MTSSSKEWYSDPDLLLEELREHRSPTIPPPVVPGYQDLTELGHGGQGVVYAATQRSTGQRVAIKVLRDGALATRSSRWRFKQEISLVAKMHHANIVRVYDSGVTPDGRRFAVMEYIEGRPLDKWCEAARQGRSAESYIAAAVTLFIKVCDAVCYAHLLGIVHRDLKPGNILVGPDAEPHVLDFGLAKSTALESAASTATQSGQFMGTYAWASPEQTEGFPQGIDVRTDVYSLGVILYQMLTGRFPYDVTGPDVEVLCRIKAAAPIRPRSVNPSLNDDLETILITCLAKDATRRYQNAGELAADLRRFQAGEPIAAKRDSTVYVLRKLAHRHRASLAAAAAFLVVLIASSVLAWVLYAEARSQREAAEGRSEQLVRRQYVDQLRLASAAYQSGNLNAMRARLEECPAGLRRWEWSYLYRLSHPSDLVLGGGEGEVFDVAVTADGQWIASAGRNGAICLWDAESGRLEKQWASQQQLEATAVAFSPDGMCLAFSLKNGEVTLCGPPDWRETRLIPHGHGQITALAFSPDGRLLAVADSSNEISLYSPADCREQGPRLHLEQYARRLAFSPDPGGRWLAAASVRACSIWDTHHLASGAHARLEWADADPNDASSSHACVAFSPDGSRVATANRQHAIEVRTLPDGKVQHTLVGHTRDVGALAWSSDGRWLVSGGWDQVIRWWNMDEPGESSWMVRGHTQSILALSLSRDGGRLVSAGSDGEVHVWHHPLAEGGADVDGTPVLALRSGGSGCLAAASSGESRVICGCNGARVFDLDRPQSWALPFAAHIGATALSPDGRWLAQCHVSLPGEPNGQKHGQLLLRAADTGEVTWRSPFVRIASGVVHVPAAFSPDGRRVVAAYASKGAGLGGHRLTVWDAATGQELFHLAGGDYGWVMDVAWSSTGDRIATAGTDRSVRLWDAAFGRELFSLAPHRADVTCVAFSPDSRLIASGDKAGVCRLWNAAEGILIEPVLRANAAEVHALAFHPDPEQRRLATGDVDGNVKLWDVESGDEVLNVSFGQDVRRLAFDRATDALVAAVDTPGLSTPFVLESRPHPSDEIRQRLHRARAWAVVDRLFDELLVPTDVLEELQRDPDFLALGAAAQAEAVAEAQACGMDLNSLGDRSWKIVEGEETSDEVAGQSRKYEQALRLAEYVCRLMPGDVCQRHTLGVAEYRCGRYDKALKTFMWTESQRGSPKDAAFLAMTLWRLKRVEEALANLEIAESRWRLGEYGDRLEVGRFCAEARRLIAP